MLVGAAVRTADGVTPCPSADGATRELRACLQQVVPFIETEWAVGSGVLIEDGYVVTNAHVVDPWPVATVTVAGERFEDVPVVGIDAVADIALLGPLDADLEGLTLVPLDDVIEDEPAVFLIGYPGGVEDDEPQVSISDGVVSRLRDDDMQGLSYIQTDAAIAGGQSGGALVDGSGRVLGISGLSFAGEFALVLTIDDVIAALDGIRDDGGTERRVMPLASDDDLVTEATIDLSEFDLGAPLLFPAGGERTIELTVDPADEVAIEAATLFGESLGANELYLEGFDELSDEDLEAIEEFDESGRFDDIDQLEEVRPGTFLIDLPADEVVVVSLGVAEESTITVAADDPFLPVESTLDGEDLRVGASTRGVIDSFTLEIVHRIEIDEPGEYEVTVSAGASDSYVTVLAPGEEYELFDDVSGEDGGGLYGLDAVYEFTVDEDDVGTWTIVLGTWDRVTTGYVVRVERT